MKTADQAQINKYCFHLASQFLAWKVERFCLFEQAIGYQADEPEKGDEIEH